VLGSQRIAGIHEGIDDEGALLLGNADGQRRYNAGEVSLRAVFRSDKKTEPARK